MLSLIARHNSPRPSFDAPLETPRESASPPSPTTESLRLRPLRGGDATDKERLTGGGRLTGGDPLPSASPCPPPSPQPAVLIVPFHPCPPPQIEKCKNTRKPPCG
jgi:hypothetical protein